MVGVGASDDDHDRGAETQVGVRSRCLGVIVRRWNS